MEPEDGGEEASQGELDDPVGHHDPGRRVQQAVLARKPIWKKCHDEALNLNNYFVFKLGIDDLTRDHSKVCSNRQLDGIFRAFKD